MFEMVGNFFVPEEGTVDITDPCYRKGVWCRTSLNVKPGKYRCYVEKVNFGAFGKRNGKIAIVHNSMPKFPDLLKWERKVAEIGVDAGLAGFFINKPDFNDDEWNDFCTSLWRRDKLECVHYYFDKYNGASEFNAFYSESGCGDGTYPVNAYKDKDGTIIGLLIDFA